MNNKTILVLIDALNYKTAVSAMGFLNHLTETKMAAFFKVKAGLPTLSRPRYEGILTGTQSFQNGILNNQIVKMSHEESIFSLCKKNGIKTGAAAYYWISELYNKAPFNMIQDREQHNEELNIQHGKFYFEDSYPDSHLFCDGEIIRRIYDPGFLLIHPMGVDDIGHKFGCESKEYRAKALEIDSILSMIVPLWMQENYNIIITADHGMDTLGLHGGIEDYERKVPMWVISNLIDKKTYNNDFDQSLIAPMICDMLNIDKSEKMQKIDYELLKEE